MTRRLVAVLATCALAVPLSGCGGEDGGGTTPSATAYLPTDSPTRTVTMISPPGDYTSVQGEGFTISAPAEFQRRQRTSSNGEPMLVLEKPSSEPAIPQRVAVVRDVQPKSPAAEQSYALEAAKAAAGPAAKAERVQLPTKREGESAFLTTWNEVRPTKGSSTVEVTYWQLMYQVDASLILNVVALAPADEFETSEVSKILRTFVPRKGAQA